MTSLCGCKPRLFSANKVFTYFTGEIAKVQMRELWRENQNPIKSSKEFSAGHEKEEVFVATAFGICSGLLRQKEFSKDGFVLSEKFKDIVREVNAVVLDDGGGGSKGHGDVDPNQVTPKTGRIRNLQSQVNFYREKASSIFATPPPTPSSTSTGTSRSQIKPTISEIAQDPLVGPIIKKRVISARCDEVLSSLNENCGDEIGAVFGFAILYGSVTVKKLYQEQMAITLRILLGKYDITVCWALIFGEGAEETKQFVAKRVPDWVQLYVKLKSKIPDAAWQTILNYLNLGRSGVSLHVVYCLICFYM